MMLVLYGPTAVGKTALALRLAKQLNAEIISVDSRQIYRGLDIGSGKVSFENKVFKHSGYWIVDGIKINGFDLVSPGQNWSVADFLVYAKKQIERIQTANKSVIVVGGTGFYIHSLLFGLDSIGIPEDKRLRQSLEKLTVNQLFNKLHTIDPERALLLNDSDKKNPRRLVRAIEICQSAHQHKNTKPQTVKYDIIFGLNANNSFLYQKSDAWLIKRLKNGLLDEIKALLQNGVDVNWLLGLGLEYRWLTKYVQKDISREEALEKLKGDTHDFIRRQKTWFKKFPEIKIIDIESVGDIKNAAKEILNLVAQKSF